MQGERQCGSSVLSALRAPGGTGRSRRGRDPSKAHQSPEHDLGCSARGMRADFSQKHSNCSRVAPSAAPATVTWFPFCFAPSLCDIQTMAVRHSASLSTCREIFLPTQNLGEVRYLLHRFLRFAADVFYLTIENYYNFKAEISFLIIIIPLPQYITSDFKAKNIWKQQFLIFKD